MRTMHYGSGVIKPLVTNLVDELFEAAFEADVHFLIGIKLFDTTNNALFQFDLVVITNGMIAIAFVDEVKDSQGQYLEIVKSILEQTFTNRTQVTSIPVHVFWIGSHQSVSDPDQRYFTHYQDVLTFLSEIEKHSTPLATGESQMVIEAILNSDNQAQSHHRHALVGKILHLLQAGMTPFVDKHMEYRYGAEWHKQFAPDRISKTRIDVQVLLKVILDQWQGVFGHVLEKLHRTFIHELLTVRNQWAHQELFSFDDVYRVADTTERLLRTIAPPEALAIEQLKRDLLREQFSPRHNASVCVSDQMSTNEDTDQQSESNVTVPHIVGSTSSDIQSNTSNQPQKTLMGNLVAGVKRIIRGHENFILPTDITKQLLMEMGKNSREAPRYNRYVPNYYLVQISGQNYERNFRPIEREICSQWQEDIVEHLEVMNRKAGFRKYAFPQSGEISVHIESVSAMPINQVSISSDFRDTPRNSVSLTQVAYLELSYPLHSNRRWHLAQDEVTTIGRANDCHVQLDMADVVKKSKVSGHHAYILHVDGRYKLFDGEYIEGGISNKSSSNGTYVGNQRVLSNPVDARRVNDYGLDLQDGDKITLAPRAGDRLEELAPGTVVLIFRETSD